LCLLHFPLQQALFYPFQSRDSRRFFHVHRLSALPTALRWHVIVLVFIDE
jgi:hypothetical protein